MKKNYFNDEYCQIWLHNGVVYVKYEPEVLINFEVAKRILTKRLEICNGSTYPLLTDLNKSKCIDNASRELLANEGCENLSAVAVIVHNTRDLLISNIFSYIHKFPLPFNTFMNKNRALNWLEFYKSPDHKKLIYPISLSS